MKATRWLVAWSIIATMGMTLGVVVIELVCAIWTGATWVPLALVATAAVLMGVALIAFLTTPVIIDVCIGDG